MSRHCLNCGWEFGNDFYVTKCRWCNGPFDIYQCDECGSIVHAHDMTAPDMLYCKTCYTKRYSHKADKLLKLYRQLEVIRNKLYIAHDEAFKYLVDNQPPHKPMRDIDWYKALKHFNGCCLCDNEAEIQWLVIRPIDGGKYSSTNVLPLCCKCHEVATAHRNPIAALDARLNADASVDSLIKLKEGLKWLGYKI